MSSSTVAHHHDTQSTIVFGFWIYIMSDCILFATLFATFAVLHTNTFGGPGPKELFSMPIVLAETFILLTSSFTYGLALLAAFRKHQSQVIGFLMTIGNTYGVLLIIVLMGHGLIALPKRLWELGDYSSELIRLYLSVSSDNVHCYWSTSQSARHQ